MNIYISLKSRGRDRIGADIVNFPHYCGIRNDVLFE
jgi:hypothetical protein